MDAREERGRVIAERCRIVKIGSAWMVPAQSSPGRYAVQFEAGVAHCTCLDYQTRGIKCKHAWAVEISMTQVEQHADGTATVTELSVKAERKTYAQDWANYNAAQVNERRHFHELLSDLCAAIEEPEVKRGRGRPGIPIQDAIFAAVLKVYSLTSARRFSGELADAHERGYLTYCPHFNSVLNVFDKPETTPILRGMILRSALPLRDMECDWAVDSTGFASTKYNSWHDHKWGTDKKRCQWVKAHFTTGVKTNIVPVVDIFDQHANDCPQLPALVKSTAKSFEVREVSADAAYPSKANFAAVESVGGTFFPAFPADTTGGVGGSFAKAFHWFQFNKEEYLAHYHKRSLIETTVSMVKRKFGHAVKAKNDLAQKNEVYAKFVCHNLCVLIAEMYAAGIRAVFGPDEGCTKNAEPAQILRFQGGF